MKRIKMESDDEASASDSIATETTVGLVSPTQAPRSLPPGAPANYCNICNKELCNKYFMKTHMQKMHGINLDEYPREAANSGGVVCDICQKELCSKYFLKVHKSNTHGITDFTTGSAGSQAANAATAVAAIALTSSLNNAQKQIQSQQALLNAAAVFNPAAAAAAMMAMHHHQQQQQQHQQQHHPQQQQQQQISQLGSYNSNSMNGQQAAIDLRYNPLNHLLARQAVAAAAAASAPRDLQQQLVNSCNSTINNNNAQQFQHSEVIINSQQQQTGRKRRQQQNGRARQQKAARLLFQPQVTPQIINNNIDELDDGLIRSAPAGSEEPDSDRDSLDNEGLSLAAQSAGVQTRDIGLVRGNSNLGLNSPAGPVAGNFDESLLIGSSININRSGTNNASRNVNTDDELNNDSNSLINDSNRRKSPAALSLSHQVDNLTGQLAGEPEFRLAFQGKQSMHLQQQQQAQQNSRGSNPNSNRSTINSNCTPNTTISTSIPATTTNCNNSTSSSSSSGSSNNNNNILPSQISNLLFAQAADSSNINSPLGAPSAVLQRGYQTGATMPISQLNCQPSLVNTVTTPITPAPPTTAASATTVTQTGNSSNSSRYLRHYTEACPICDRRFKSIKWLQSHVMNDHKNEIGNLFNLLVQVLLCGSSGVGQAAAVSGADGAMVSSQSQQQQQQQLLLQQQQQFRPPSPRESSPASLQGSSDSPPIDGSTLVFQHQASPSPPQMMQTPDEQQPPPPGLGAVGGLAGALAGLINLQQQIQSLQAASHTQQQQQQPPSQTVARSASPAANRGDV